MTCNLRRLREVDLRPEGGDLETPEESGKKWQKLKDLGISLDMVETMEYAAYVFMPGSRVFRETQMDLYKGLDLGRCLCLMSLMLFFHLG